MRWCRSVRSVEARGCDQPNALVLSRTGLPRVFMPSRAGDLGADVARPASEGEEPRATLALRLAESGAPGPERARARLAKLGTVFRRRVQSSGLGGLGRDPLSKCLWGDHLGMRSIGEEVVERMVDPLELRDHRRALPLVNDTGRSEVAGPGCGGRALSPRSARALARTPQTGGPGGGKVEVRRPS